MFFQCVLLTVVEINVLQEWLLELLVYEAVVVAGVCV